MLEVSRIGRGMSLASLLFELKNRPFIILLREREQSTNRIKPEISRIV